MPLAGASAMVRAPRVIGGSVRSLADRHARHRMPVPGIGDRHDLPVAYRKETMVHAIDGQPGRAVAAGQRPRGFDSQLAAVDDNHLSGFALDVDVDSTGAVIHGEFRLIGNGQGGDDRQSLGVNDRDILTLAVKSEYVPAGRFIENGVRVVRWNLHFPQDLQRVEIEDRDGIRPAVAREATMQICGERDTVHPLRVGDATDHGSRIRVHDIDPRAPADEQSVCCIDGEVVPAAVASELPALHYLHARIRGRRRCPPGDQAQSN